ncbi:MAG: hypothetical protein OEV93_04035 [Candidatus Moranbacteria bacterium]|nr:hypothetical protein [Candidatus Moranbacteria bacterium]
MIFIATHGFRFSGKDPIHTIKGLNQIDYLIAILETKQIATVVVGTGSRFQEMYDILKSAIPEGARKVHAIFCGTSDGLEEDGVTVILNNGRQVHIEDYAGLIKSRCFNPWEFIKMFGDNVLFLAGGELMLALGLGDINEKGQLYEIDPETKTGRKIS